jgi:ZIP family zinc transporter
MTIATTPVLLGLAASAATVLGGLAALKWRREIATIVGLAAGAVFGIAIFDLFPEAFEFGRGTYRTIDLLVVAAVGCMIYAALTILLSSLLRNSTQAKVQLSLTSMTVHSFLDGFGIGLGFQLAPSIGWVVAAAVLAHDMADGCNTVALALMSEDRKLARRWLLANGAAPTLGVLSAGQFHLTGEWIAPVTAILGGIFLYVAVSQLLPRSRALRPGFSGYFVNVIGACLIYGVTELIG